MKAPMHWPMLVLVASASAALGLNRHLSCVRSLVCGRIYYLQLCQLRLSIDGTALCERHSIERSILLLQPFLSHQLPHSLQIHTNEIVCKCVHWNLAFDCTIWTLPVCLYFPQNSSSDGKFVRAGHNYNLTRESILARRWLHFCICKW